VAIRPVVKFLPFMVSGFCMLAFLLAFFLPRSIALIGKERKDDQEPIEK